MERITHVLNLQGEEYEVVWEVLSQPPIITIKTTIILVANVSSICHYTVWLSTPLLFLSCLYCNADVDSNANIQTDLGTMSAEIVIDDLYANINSKVNAISHTLFSGMEHGSSEVSIIPELLTVVHAQDSDVMILLK